ncbi:uncharacterized protein LOC122503897 [Leptopilina heterotoma]|uniref:uncharacterized protein LOC122503897 n=1 Tax=Leptopilina heterotoma TaxID=63436 RepID=UPI001CA90C78|nr:uncharacterized protein LOC122503897 [Leptopilina heterotoma]
MIDRFSRWVEAVPLKDIEAITVYRAFVDGWLSRFRVPEKVTTDQGSQFESLIFRSLLQMSGCYRTTAYHPAANRIIERWHRTLKAALMCHNGEKWIRVLSTVLLGLRTNVFDSGASPAEYLYRTTLKIPGEFILPEEFVPNPQIFLEEFRENIRLVKPVPVEHKHKRKIFVHKDLNTCSHIFLRLGRIKKSLESPYSGPHKITKRISDRILEIDVNGIKKNVSIENVKPAFFARENLTMQSWYASDNPSSSSSPFDVVISSPDNIVQTPMNNTPLNSDNSNQNHESIQLPKLRTYTNKKKKVTFNFANDSDHTYSCAGK